MLPYYTSPLMGEVGEPQRRAGGGENRENVSCAQRRHRKIGIRLAHLHPNE